MRGAIVSAYNAAQAVIDRTGMGSRIDILEPAGVSVPQAQMLKLALAPHVYWAKAWSIAERAKRAHPDA